LQFLLFFCVQALAGVPVEERCKCKPNTQELQNKEGGK
jgi:hypothetical protein